MEKIDLAPKSASFAVRAPRQTITLMKSIIFSS
jgi:hypothetical protein